MIQSPDYFVINGVSSRTIPDIYVDTPSVPPMAQQRYTTYQNGADEDGTSPDNTFENISYTLTFYTFDRTDFDNTDIYSFLANAETLSISRLDGYYFKVREVHPETPENVSQGRKIRYRIGFTLAPFRYFTDNPEITVSDGDVIKNSGTRYSRPVFKIVGNGDIKLNVNGETFEVRGLDAGVETVIDSSRYITYSVNDLFFNRTIGKYPFLAVGDNIVSWEGDVRSVKIVKNERCY
ncbi:MAG: hypothetical protein K2J36_02355 [Ruminococcus sp.]|nr:hypothetical protein [Ruminococcus sp.]